MSAAYRELLSDPGPWLNGLAFSLTLLAILLAHEMGHYVTCMRNGLDASLPYFMPFPSLIGTLGAFIRIRSPIYSRQVLFDVGFAGPLAGFLLVLPAAIVGIACSRVVPGIAERGDLNFGTPALFWIFQHLFFPGAASADISLHPVARGAWVGVFATALNLLPIGQLDGGHILYAFRGRPAPADLTDLESGAVCAVRSLATLAGLGAAAVLPGLAAPVDLRPVPTGRPAQENGAHGAGHLPAVFHG